MTIRMIQRRLTLTPFCFGLFARPRMGDPRAVSTGNAEGAYSVTASTGKAEATTLRPSTS